MEIASVVCLDEWNSRWNHSLKRMRIYQDYLGLQKAVGNGNPPPLLQPHKGDICCHTIPLLHLQLPW